MARIVIEFPDECKSLVAPLQAVVSATARMTKQAAGGRAMPFAQWEQEIGEAVAAVERQSHRAVLQSLDIDAPYVRIWNALYKQVGRYPSTYRRVCLDLLRDTLLPVSNVFCYGQVESPYGSGQFYE